MNVWLLNITNTVTSFSYDFLINVAGKMIPTTPPETQILLLLVKIAET